MKYLSLIRCVLGASALIAHLSSAKTVDAPLPELGTYVHNGVASCATSACHGKVAPVTERNVQLNEYHLWSTQDRHSRAYQTLLNDQSKQIARNLGIPSAHTAKMCLDCHADNVPAASRGPKFQLSDGVGCEACHGGSQNWIKKHTEPEATHASNIADGLYPSENPYPRAALCLSCHMGTKSKFADHEIMAAGHPRLTFELDTFTANQPAHYKVDADYRTRKGEPSVGYLWMVGQVESGKRLLTLIDEHGGKFAAKDIAIYDCHACHRPMNLQRSQHDPKSLPVGSPRLLDYSLDMLAALFNVLLPAEQSAWRNEINQLQLATLAPANIAQVSAQMRSQIARLEQQLSSSAPTATQVKALRKHLAETGATGAYDDFTSAEQAFLAIEALSYSLGDRNAYEAGLDKLYASVDNEFNFDASKFRQAINALAKQL